MITPTQIPQLNIPLKPCPFCGKTGNICVEYNGQWWVYCADCGGSSGYDLGESGACEAWNTRPIETQLLEALKYIANEDVDPWITQICAEAIIKAEGAPYMSYGTQRQSVISLMSTTKPKPPSPQQKGVTNDRA